MGTKTTTTDDTQVSTIPDAPVHLTSKAARQWQADYATALNKAMIENPGDERAQRVTALKAANSMLSITPPTSAAEIDALDVWQVVKDTRKTIDVDGVQTRVCVTTDGRKYAFPITKNGK